MKLHMIEAFNSSTSDIVEIGKSDDADYLADIPSAVMQTTSNVASGEVITTDATQIGDWRSVSQSETGADGVAYDSDVQVIVELTSTGTLDSFLERSMIVSVVSFEVAREISAEVI